MADETIALQGSMTRPQSLDWNAATPLLQAQQIRSGQTQLQMLGRQNTLQDIGFRNQLIANAAAHAMDADSWDAAMQAAVKQGAPEAGQFVGRYTPLLQQRLFESYSGAPPSTQGAAPATGGGAATAAGGGAAAVGGPTDQYDRLYQNVAPDKMAASLQKLNMVNDALMGVRDQASWDAAMKQLSAAGIPQATQFAGAYSPLRVQQLWQSIQPVRAYLQNRVAASSTGLPSPLVKNDVQAIGDTGYSVNPYEGTAKPITPAKLQIVQDPVVGPRTILPDKDGQWHYVDTGEAVAPSQTPNAAGSSTGGVSLAEIARRTRETENTTGNPAAKNPLSSAEGNSQFTNDTWLSTFKATYPKQAKTLSDQQILSLRDVPAVDDAMTQDLAAKNAALLAKEGIPVTSASVILAHKFGATGAIKILEAKQDTPLEDILPPKVISDNKLAGQTSGDYVKGLAQKVGNDPVEGFGGKGEAPFTPVSDDPSRPFKGASTTSQTMVKAQQLGLHGQAFLDAVPSQLRNDIEAVGNYDEPLTIFSKMGRAGMSQDRALGWVRQFNPDYDSYFASARGASVKEFLAGGPNSPAAQIRSYNTAIGHAGDAYDAMEEMEKVHPGFLKRARDADMPFASYVASELRNASLRGTSMGAALAKFKTASDLYGAEVSKLYSGSAGSQEERNTIRSPLDPNKSPDEIKAGLATSVHMMGSRAGALEDQYKTAMDAPGLGQYGTKEALKDFPVLHDRARATLSRILGEPAAGMPISAPTIDLRDAMALHAHGGDPAWVAAIDKKYGAGAAAKLLSAAPTSAASLPMPSTFPAVNIPAGVAR